MRVRTLLMAGMALWWSLAKADDLVWTPLAAFGGATVFALGADPHTPGTLYTGIDQQGLFKSTDAGLTWLPSGAGLPTQLVTGIAFGSEPDVVWVVASDSLYESADGGASWTYVPLPTDYDEEYAYLHVAAVATDPNVPNLVYADVWLSLANSIWPEHAVRSTNGGAEWSVLPVRTYYTACGGIRVDPFSSAVQFSSSYVSHDFGETWTGSVNWCPALAWDPSDASVLYRGRFDGVERSGDGGATWVAVGQGLEGPGVSSLAVDPFDPTVVYAGSAGIFTRIFPKRADPTLLPRSRSAPRQASERP